MRAAEVDRILGKAVRYQAPFETGIDHLDAMVHLPRGQRPRDVTALAQQAYCPAPAMTASWLRHRLARGRLRSRILYDAR
jgi:hypothetical protein